MKQTPQDLRKQTLDLVNANKPATEVAALVGAWRKPGGGILQLPLWAFPINWEGLHRADLIPEGTPVVNQWHLGRALAHDLALQTPIESLFVYNSNPLVVAPDQLAAVQADLARLQLAHWQIGEVVTAPGGERVRIG